MTIIHPHGNIKIAFTKRISYILSNLIFFIFKIFYPKVNSKSNGILISRATFKPWLEDKKYLAYYEKIKLLTILDHPRLYTLYNFSKQLEKINSDKKDQKSKLTNKKRALEEIEQLINKLYADKKSQEKREQQLAEIRKMQKMVTNGNFNSMKGKLPWPINGKVISKFGNKKNQKLKTVTENLGINIKSSNSTQVIAVLDGVVSTITYIRGHGNIVIIDHGGGFSTVYAHIDKINVIENEYVQIGDEFAVVASPNSGSTAKLHFEVWGNQKKLNPIKWLVAK